MNGTSGQDPAFDIHGDGGTGWGSGGTACGADASGQPWPSWFPGAVAPADGFPRLVMVDGGSRTSTHRFRFRFRSRRTILIPAICCCCWRAEEKGPTSRSQRGEA